MRTKGYFLGCLLAFLAVGQLHADFAIKNGSVVDAETLPTTTIENHYAMGLEAFQKKDWKEVVKQFKIITYNFPNSSYAKRGYFNLGVGCYYESEFEESNTAFTNYLKLNKHPENFEEAMRYKLAIANAFSLGATRHMFGLRQMPSWLYGYELGLEIYDEIISTMPAHDLAAQALYSKATYHWRYSEHRDAVETFQMLIRRFPKHPLSAEAYVHINKVYIDQAKRETQNPDIIAFAELNATKFQNDFPGEPRLEESRSDVQKIKELYAAGLFETGQYYERTKQSHASVIYYKSALKQFPDTNIAKKCQKRLKALDADVASHVVSE